MLASRAVAARVLPLTRQAHPDAILRKSGSIWPTCSIRSASSRRSLSIFSSLSEGSSSKPGGPWASDSDTERRAFHEAHRSSRPRLLCSTTKTILGFYHVQHHAMQLPSGPGGVPHVVDLTPQPSSSPGVQAAGSQSPALESLDAKKLREQLQESMEKAREGLSKHIESLLEGDPEKAGEEGQVRITPLYDFYQEVAASNSRAVADQMLQGAQEVDTDVGQVLERVARMAGPFPYSSLYSNSQSAVKFMLHGRPDLGPTAFAACVLTATVDMVAGSVLAAAAGVRANPRVAGSAWLGSMAMRWLRPSTARALVRSTVNPASGLLRTLGALYGAGKSVRGYFRWRGKQEALWRKVSKRKPRLPVEQLRRRLGL